MTNVLVFPLLYYGYFGKPFNLVKFSFLSRGNPFDMRYVDDYVTRTNITNVVSKYQLVETRGEFAKFLGIDDVSYLKNRISHWDQKIFRSLWMPIQSDNSMVNIAVKMGVQTANETVSTATPKISGEPNLTGDRVYTHYLKSVILGAEFHAMIDVHAKNETHYHQIRQKLIESVGSQGNFDKSFKKKLDLVVMELETSYQIADYASYGIEFHECDCVAGLIELKKDLETDMTYVKENSQISFEFHSLSELYPGYPETKIKSEFLEAAMKLRESLDDIYIAGNEIRSFIHHNPNIYDKYSMIINAWYRELDDLQNFIFAIVSRIDITEGGDAHQFDQFYRRFGTQHDPKKYTNRIRNFMKELQEAEKMKKIISENKMKL